jgi:predicted Rossmann fold nucleotide-binding protein DprA/Smf involved in DNA uptake
MITPDSQAIYLLCSHLALPSKPDPAPFTLREWNPLARRLAAEGLRPGDLLGMSSADMGANLALEPGLAERAARLMERSGALAIALERLASLGISGVTRADANYPARYRQRLKDSAPAVLFFAGEVALLGQNGIAVVGSRKLDEAGIACAEFVGNACGMAGLVLVSGGAKGVDSLSMNAALEARGQAVGVLADSLEQAIRRPDFRPALTRGDLCLATPYSPNAPFSAGTAMGRNKLIYTLADYAIVVASDVEKGGTWGGATEALKAGWLPVFVLEHPAMPEGNRRLIEKGGLPFPHPFPLQHTRLPAWLEEQAANSSKPASTQLTLF